VNKHDVAHVSNAASTRKVYEDEGVDFDMILQAQQANSRLQVRQHEQYDLNSSDNESTVADLEVHAHEQYNSDSSDDGSYIYYDLEVNAHNLKKKGRALPKIKGLMEFSESEDEKEYDETHFDSAEDA